ncbi:MAG: hypothetical protein ACYDDV_00430 [Methanoregula sp.]
MKAIGSFTGCPNVPDCGQCPEFIPCTRALMDDMNRRSNNTIFAGETTFNPADFIEHGILLVGIVPA